MKVKDINKIVPLKKKDISIPLEGLSEEELKSIYYGDLIDPSIWY